MAALISAARPAIQRVQPLDDPRWDQFVDRSRDSSVFHTRGWLDALRRTYGYEPVVFTTSSPAGDLEDCLLFCRVNSWLTGTRLVSLPFSDHCAPLVRNPSELPRLLEAAVREVQRGKMDYLELRPRSPLAIGTAFPSSEYSYCFHQLDLTADLDTVFRRLHRDSTQRKIRRAERDRLTYEEGRSEWMVDAFYRLMVLTRRRHRIPPQPKHWFQNLADCLGDRLKIRIASANGEPAAAVLTLRHKDVLMYKYGASEPRFHKLGAMHLLLWRCIQEAKREGIQALDLGRSSTNDLGLITFKDHWGATRSNLTYSRHGMAGRFEYRPDECRKERYAKYLVSHLPGRLFEAVGQLLYRHIG